MIRGAYDLLENIKIHRSPWFNFMEEAGQRGALQAIFEHFPLKTTCTLPPLPPISTLMKDENAIFAFKKKRSRSPRRVDPSRKEKLLRSDFTRSGLDPGSAVGNKCPEFSRISGVDCGQEEK
jgi:hypothetical protein